VPKKFQDHPLVKDKVFLTLPPELLNGLGFALQQNPLWDLECELAAVSGDHTSQIGFSAGKPLIYHYLRRIPADAFKLPDNFDPRSLGWQQNVAQIEHALKVGESRARPFAEAAKGYLGWLVLNPAFLAEQDQLIAKWRKVIGTLGVPQLGKATTGKPPAELRARGKARPRSYFDEFDHFYLRWRLCGMAARDVPVPLTPQTPVPAPILALGPMNMVGGLFYFPDVYPIPSRDTLRGLLEDSLRRGGNKDHLAEWIAIVSGNNPAKNQIARYARLFEIQHYLRILFERYAEQLKGHIDGLESALADFFGCSSATIHREISFIRNRQGQSRAISVVASSEPSSKTKRRTGAGRRKKPR
jgi:hypothetical protein